MSDFIQNIRLEPLFIRVEYTKDELKKFNRSGLENEHWSEWVSI